MLSIKLRYCYEDVDRWGNVRTYYWAGRGYRKIRLRERQGTEEFMAEYYAAKELIAAGGAKLEAGPPGLGRPAPHTFRWLCAQYSASPEFKRLDARTQRIRRRLLDQCCDEPLSPGSSKRFADCPLAAMTSKHVKVLRDRRADKPEAANNRLKALRAAFKWGAGSESIRENPARDVVPLKNPTEGFHTWTPSEVRAFEERHPIGSKARLALGLLLYLGVRRSDVVRLGRQHIRDGFISFIQQKLRRQRMTKLELPILPALKEILDASELGNASFLETEYGKPFTAAGFGGWFRDRCDEAGLPHCSAHGLRKAGATTAAENGATTHQLMAIFGWSTMKEPERYTRKARQKLIADSAMALLVPRTSAGPLAHVSEH